MFYHSAYGIQATCESWMEISCIHRVATKPPSNDYNDLSLKLFADQLNFLSLATVVARQIQSTWVVSYVGHECTYTETYNDEISGKSEPKWVFATENVEKHVVRLNLYHLYQQYVHK